MVDGPQGINRPGGDYAPELPSDGQDIDAPDGDDTFHVSDSFADDVVGAQLKLSESARQKAARERRTAEARRRLANWMKVREASTFGNADQENTGRTFVKGGPQAAQTEVQEASRDTHALKSQTLEQQEKVAAQLFEELNVLLEEIDALGGFATLQASSQGAHDAAVQGRLAQLLELSQQKAAYERRVRDLLMVLLSGGFGFEVMGDPKLTFRRLFSRIRQWPSSIPPGQLPKSADDYDAFVAWIFAPPDIDPRELSID